MTSYLALRSSDLGDRLRADVVVGNFEIVERQPPPAFGLRAEPGVDEGDARGANGMRLYAGSSAERDDLQTQICRGAIKIGSARVSNHK